MPLLQWEEMEEVLRTIRLTVKSFLARYLNYLALGARIITYNEMDGAIYYQTHAMGS